MNKLLSSALSLLLFLAAPGRPAYAAVAGAKVSVPSGAGAPISLPAGARLSPMSGSGLSLLGSRPGDAPLTLGVPAPKVAPALPAPAARQAPAASPSLPSALPAAPSAALAPAGLAPAAAPFGPSLAAAQEGVAAALSAAGDIAEAAPASASALGRRLEDIVLGARSRPAAEGLSAPAAAPLLPLASDDSLAKPAGDSIRQAAEAGAAGETKVPGPPARDGGAPAPRGNGPLAPRLLASAIALLPAYFLGWPLLAAQGTVIGGLLVASSIGMALMPFLGPDAAKTLRAVPGVTLGLTGLTAAGVAVSLSYGLGVPTAMSLLGPGIFAALGGWGLVRYSVSGPGRRFDKLESVGAFFGGISALTLIGLAAVGPAGPFATGLLWLGYPLSMLLWPHLPGWMGEGVRGGFLALERGARGALRVAGAAGRDTVLIERLLRFSSRMYRSWKGNAVWLGLLVWGPVLLVEALIHLAGLLSGLLVGLTQVPAMAAWGAVHQAFPGSRAAVGAAELALPAFENVTNGKKSWFNPAEKRLLRLANSPSVVEASLGAAGLRGLQLLWLAGAPAASALLALGGVLFAFARGGAPYDASRHDPAGLRLSRDDGFEKPDLDDEAEPSPGGVPAAAKAFTGLLALAPAVYFGLPLLLEGFSLIRAGLFLSAALALAASPFFGKSTPHFLRSLTGTALVWNGWFMLFTGHAIVAGLIAALGGWGYRNRLRRLQESRDERFDEFDASVFFGSLGAVVALGAEWAGLAGWPLWAALGLGALSSPLLLRHLPSWAGAAAVGALRSLGRSVAGFHAVMSFWYRSDFMRNMSAHWSYWIEKHWTHGIWLSPLWVPLWLLYAAENILALALGLAFGSLRAPFQALADALDEAKPGSRRARYAKGFVDGWFESAEGSQKLFDRATAPLQEAMKARHPVSGRPTFGAALAFLAARAAQALWLGYALLALPLGFFYGLYAGLRSLAGAPPDAR